MIAAAEPVIVFVENGCEAFGVAGGSLILLQIHPVIFHLTDLGGDAADELRLVVGFQLLLIDCLPQELILLLLPENIVGPITVGQLQDLKKDRMERAEGNRRTAAVRQLQIPLLHLPRRRFCKGNNQNLSGMDVTDFRQIPDPPGKHHGFP